MKGLKAERWGSCYQTGDQGGREFVTMSNKLALKVSGRSLLFCKGLTKRLLIYCVNIKYLNVM